jgi:hypothetical protein
MCNLLVAFLDIFNDKTMSTFLQQFITLRCAVSCIYVFKCGSRFNHQVFFDATSAGPCCNEYVSCSCKVQTDFQNKSIAEINSSHQSVKLQECFTVYSPECNKCTPGLQKHILCMKLILHFIVLHLTMFSITQIIELRITESLMHNEL